MGQAVSNDARPYAAAMGVLAVLLGAPLLTRVLPADARIAVGLLAVGAAVVGGACVAVGRRATVRVPWVSLALVYASAPLFLAPPTISFNPGKAALLTYFVGALGIWVAVFDGKRTKSEAKHLDEPARGRRQALGLLGSILILVVAAVPIVDVAADTGAPTSQEGVVTEADQPKHPYDPYVVAVGELRFRRADPMPRVVVGDRVRVVIRPGALGLAWVGDLERLKRAP